MCSLHSIRDAQDAEVSVKCHKDDVRLVAEKDDAGDTIFKLGKIHVRSAYLYGTG